MITFSYLLFSINAYAQDCGNLPGTGRGIQNPVLPWLVGCSNPNEGDQILGNIIGAVVGMFIIVGFVAALIYILIGGMAWLTASGDKTKLQVARDRITQAILGLIILVSTWAIMTLIGDFTGLDFPLLPLPKLTP